MLKVKKEIEVFDYSEIEQNGGEIFVCFEGITYFPYIYEIDDNVFGIDGDEGECLRRINGYVEYSIRETFELNDDVPNSNLKDYMIDIPTNWLINDYETDIYFGGSIYEEGAFDILENYQIYSSMPSIKLEIETVYRCIDGNQTYLFKINKDLEFELL